MSENERVVRSLFERVWNTGEVAAVDGLLASRYTIHQDPGDPWDGQTLTIDGFKDRFTKSRAPFRDLRFDIMEIVAHGDRVAVNWVMRGTNTGELAGRPATGRAIESRGITIYYLEDGRISGHTQVVDRLAVMQQLGMLG
jgi:steroid delta-isomerase-like uncharacterized protein